MRSTWKSTLFASINKTIWY